MPINAYTGIAKSELIATRKSSEGKEYTLNHDNFLVVNMSYLGEESSSGNSQGWERNHVYYFNTLQSKHPEFFSKKNTRRIAARLSPRIDATFLRYFPQFKGFENEVIVHHHIGSDGQAVAVPQSLHKGYGEIHVIERQLGITENAREFSDKCKHVCDGDASYIGKTVADFIPIVLKKTSDSKHLYKGSTMIETTGQFTSNKKGGISMSEDMTIRDPDEMEKFAAEVETYCSEMKTACNNLKSSLSSAESGMKDRVSKKALQRVEQLAEDLLAGLPAVEGTAEMLKKAAKPLKQARTLM